MKATAFREAIPARLREQLPPAWQHFEHRSRFSLVQLWYGDPVFHFEIWPQSKQGVIEIGLHLEHPRAAQNAALHRFFDGHFLEIRHEIGELWLEKWDRGWHKLYCTLPFAGYSEALLDTVCHLAAQQITVLQPLLDEALQEMG